MSDKSCRYAIRKSARMGVTIEEVHDEAFADDYYAQLQNVFAKQSLAPTYDKRRVQLLLKHVLPTGNILLLRAAIPPDAASPPAFSWAQTGSPFSGVMQVGGKISISRPMRACTGMPSSIGKPACAIL